VVVQACNPRKAETGESEFKASWGSIGRPCLKKKGKKKKNSVCFFTSASLGERRQAGAGCILHENYSRVERMHGLSRISYWAGM
jgi:hypothetical protein